jgi:hypothetical protein
MNCNNATGMWIGLGLCGAGFISCCVNRASPMSKKHDDGLCFCSRCIAKLLAAHKAYLRAWLREPRG